MSLIRLSGSTPQGAQVSNQIQHLGFVKQRAGHLLGPERWAAARFGALGGIAVARFGALSGIAVARTGALSGGAVARFGALGGGAVARTGALSGIAVTRTGALSGDVTDYGRVASSSCASRRMEASLPAAAFPKLTRAPGRSPIPACDVPSPSNAASLAGRTLRASK